MAVPKKRLSITRRKWRRSHHVAQLNTMSVFLDKETGRIMRNHCAHFDENGDLVYRGKILLKAKVKSEA